MYEDWRREHAAIEFVSRVGCYDRSSKDALSTLPSCVLTMFAASSPASWMRTERPPMHPDWHQLCEATYDTGALAGIESEH